MLFMRGQQLFRRVLSADAFANPPGEPYNVGKEDANGSEGHIAIYSEDDSAKVSPAASCCLLLLFISH